MKRLVVFELHHLGDAVMALPFLRAAGKTHQVSVVCRPPVAQFLQAATTGVEILPAADSWPALAAQARALRLGKTDTAACVWADARAQILMALTGAGVRAGFPMTPHNYYAAELPWRRRRLRFGQALTAGAGLVGGRPVLTHPLDRASPDQHHLQDWEQLAQALGIVPDDSVPWLLTGGSLPAPAKDFLATQAGKKILLLHPGGRLPTKRWPFFPELLARLAPREDLAVLILQPPGESAPEPGGPNQHLVHAADWSALFAVFSTADAVVANDSFASHLAAALGKPVVAVFGSGNPAWFAPWKNRALVAATDVCPFRPCIDRCVMPSVVCLESVTVELVESRLRTALNAG